MKKMRRGRFFHKYAFVEVVAKVGEVNTKINISRTISYYRAERTLPGPSEQKLVVLVVLGRPRAASHG